METDESTHTLRFMSTLQSLFSKTNPAVKKLLGLKQNDEDTKWAEKAIELLVKKLKKKCGALDELLRAVCNPEIQSKCVTIPRGIDSRLQVLHRKDLPHVLYCKLWRWSDLRSHHELRSLEICEYPFSGWHAEVCINPYHYRRIEPTKLLTVLVPKNKDYASAPMSNERQEENMRASMPQNVSLRYTSNQQNSYGDSAHSVKSYCSSESSNLSHNSSYVSDEFILREMQQSSFETLNNVSVIEYECIKNIENTTPVTYQEASYWASIAYYELNGRVGEIFHCAYPVITVDGYTEPTNDSCRFSLGKLSSVNRNPTIENTRRHIGKGIQLHYVAGQLYVECYSEHAIFVQSRNCNHEGGFYPTTVIKIPSGCVLKIFDNVIFSHLLKENIQHGFESVYELTKMCTIRMSFVKGWGAEYQRHDITATPCWIEIHLNGPLKWLDNVLTSMGGPNNAISSVS